MEGGDPVKPTSGKTGNPVPTFTEGMTASLLSDKTAVALFISACAARTPVLLRWARSTTVANDTCVRAADGRQIRASPASTVAVCLQQRVEICCKDIKMSAPVPACNRVQVEALPLAPAGPRSCHRIEP